MLSCELQRYEHHNNIRRSRFECVCMCWILSSSDIPPSTTKMSFLEAEISSLTESSVRFNTRAASMASASRLPPRSTRGKWWVGWLRLPSRMRKYLRIISANKQTLSTGSVCNLRTTVSITRSLLTAGIIVVVNGHECTLNLSWLAGRGLGTIQTKKKMRSFGPRINSRRSVQAEKFHANETSLFHANIEHEEVAQVFTNTSSSSRKTSPCLFCGESALTACGSSLFKTGTDVLETLSLRRAWTLQMATRRELHMVTFCILLAYQERTSRWTY